MPKNVRLCVQPFPSLHDVVQQQSKPGTQKTIKEDITRQAGKARKAKTKTSSQTSFLHIKRLAK